MDNKSVLESLNKAKENSKKRNFSQTYDLIITLKNLDLKKPTEQVDMYVTLHFDRGRKTKVCALIGPELEANAKLNCDSSVLSSDFVRYAKDKKLAKKLCEENDFFIAQANIMPQVATTFGRVLGPKGKMPNPKAGCVVPPNANLKPLVERLQKLIRLTAKTSLMIQIAVGKEGMADEQVVDNVLTIYTALIRALPGETNNIRKVFLKTTMGKPVEVKL